MEQRRKEQDYKDKKEKRRLVRVMRAKFKIKKKSKTIDFAKRIAEEYHGKVDFGWTYLEMVEWCERKKAVPTLARFRNFLKKRVEWDQLKQQETNNNDEEDEYRKQTRELFKQYGRHK